MNEYIEKEILILVKTYPAPSKKYDETVCTAGMTKEGELIRIYPIDYRYLEKEKQFKKYEWIKAKVIKNENDNRSESYKIDSDSIVPTGKHLKPWEERIEKIKHLFCDSLDELNKKNMSLGIIKPKTISKLIYTEDTDEWSKKNEARLFQKTVDDFLNNREKLPLKKIPYKFQYQFNDGKDHTIVIRDWEICVLFLKYYKEDKDKQRAADMVYQKFFTSICDLKKKDVYFIVGTQHPYKTWLILGLIYPKKGTVAKLSQPTIEDFL